MTDDNETPATDEATAPVRIPNVRPGAISGLDNLPLDGSGAPDAEGEQVEVGETADSPEPDAAQNEDARADTDNAAPEGSTELVGQNGPETPAPSDVPAVAPAADEGTQDGEDGNAGPDA